MKKIIFTVYSLICLINFNEVSAQTGISPAWSHLAHATHSDMVRDLWVTTQGDSYMFGDITSLDEFFDHQGMMLLKVNNAGQEQWRNYIHGATIDWAAEARGVVGDDAGNVYVVYDEYRDPPFNNQRIVVKKYNAAGVQLWSQYLTPEVDNVVEALVTGAVVIKDGYIYATGTQHISEEVFAEVVTDGFVYKINAVTGSAQKFVYNSNQYGGDDFLLESKVDNNGNVYAIGRSKSFAGTGGNFDEFDSVLVKFDASGNVLWEHWLNGQANDEDFGISLTLDNAGNVYTSSQLKKVNIPEKEVVVQKLSPAGVVLWTYNYQGSDTEDLWRQPVEVLPNGNLALVVSNVNGIVTIGINGATGVQLWSANYNRNNTNFGNHHRDMVVDAQGNIFITGTSKTANDPGASKDIVTLKYSSGGSLLFVANHHHTNYFNFGDDGVTLALDGAGNVYTAGWVYQVGANAEFLLLKYGNEVMGTENSVKEFKVTAYPNPATDILNIAVPDGFAPDIILLTDVNGRVIKSWEYMQPGEGSFSLDVQGITSGMYLITLQSGKAMSTLKVYKQ
jgi:hypothetical protein